MSFNYKKIKQVFLYFSKCIDASKNLEGFTLIEILITVLISSIVLSIGANSFSSYSKNQVYNQNLSNLINVINNTRSRAISQVKPGLCGANVLVGFELEFLPNGTTYRQNAVCGSSKIIQSEKNFSEGINLVSGSSNIVLFNVAQGTVSETRTLGINGFGKSRTLIIDTKGVVTIQDGLVVTPLPSPSISPTGTSFSTPPPSSVQGYTRYSDNSMSKSGVSGTTIEVFAQGASSSTSYRLVAGNNGGNSLEPCSRDIIVLNPSIFTPIGSGYIAPVTGNMNADGGNWQICFREVSGSRVTSPVDFIVNSGSLASTPTPTTSPSSPTQTPTPTLTSTPTLTPTPAVITGSTSVTLSSSPNPSNRYQAVIFSVTVNGSSCTPDGYVDLFADGSNTRFSAVSLSGSNPKSGSTSYPALNSGVHSIKGRFVPYNSSTCPSADSASITHTVN